VSPPPAPDPTALQRRLTQLEAETAELRHLVQANAGFVSAASHELRAPLASMLAYLEIMADPDFGGLDAEQLEQLQVVQAGARRLHGLTDSLVDLARLDAGDLDLLLRSEDLGALLGQLAESARPEFEAAGLRLELSLPPDLPPVLCDPARTRQVLGHLLDNARRYTLPGGRVEVTLQIEHDGSCLSIAITDSGVGIAERDRPRIFERFFRAETALTTGQPGAGLGLCLSRGLQRLQGGRLHFESREGSGSRFVADFLVARASCDRELE